MKRDDKLFSIGEIAKALGVTRPSSFTMRNGG